MEKLSNLTSHKLVDTFRKIFGIPTQLWEDPKSSKDYTKGRKLKYLPLESGKLPYLKNHYKVQTII